MLWQKCKVGHGHKNGSKFSQEKALVTLPEIHKNWEGYPFWVDICQDPQQKSREKVGFQCLDTFIWCLYEVHKEPKVNSGGETVMERYCFKSVSKDRIMQMYCFWWEWSRGGTDTAIYSVLSAHTGALMETDVQCRTE